MPPSASQRDNGASKRSFAQNEEEQISKIMSAKRNRKSRSLLQYKQLRQDKDKTFMTLTICKRSGGLLEVIQIPAPGLILATPKAPINL
jgi:hypothetical protein